MKTVNKSLKLVRSLAFAILLIATVIVGTDAAFIQFKGKPIFARETGALFDGGTKIYEGFGYEIIDWNQLKEGGKKGLGVRIYPFIKKKF